MDRINEMLALPDQKEKQMSTEIWEDIIRTASEEPMPTATAGQVPRELRLDLIVSDAEAIAALTALPDGRARHHFALTAMKIGILALSQAQGRIDVEVVHNEGERLLEAMKARMERTQSEIDRVVSGSLREYFDPADGRLAERIERLVRQDGELESLMRAQTQEAARTIAQTLTEHVGSASPLMALLTPDDGNRFLAALRGSVEESLGTQTGKVLREFSLDNPDGALARLLRELGEAHGALSGNLADRIGEVVAEFSLDNPDSALSRLVSRVEQAQRTISAEFTLDSESSALTRMRRELMDVLAIHRKQSSEFQQEVLSALQAMKARREEASRSTAHGREFQNEVFAYIDATARRAGDIADDVGDTAGAISRCKVGDAVITLGPDCAAAGARIVVEAKESAAYTLRATLEECDTARRNREAGICLFVHSRRTAPDGMEPLSRFGDDIVVVWDAEDESSDTYLKAALIIAKAIAVKSRREADSQAHDLQAMEASVGEIFRQASQIEDISTWTVTIRSNAEKILLKADKVRNRILAEAELLGEQIARLKN